LIVVVPCRSKHAPIQNNTLLSTRSSASTNQNRQQRLNAVTHPVSFR